MSEPVSLSSLSRPLVDLDESGSSVTLNGLVVRSAELHQHLAALPTDAERADLARDALVVGAEVIQRSRARREVEFVERRIDQMTGRFELKLEALEERFRELLRQSLGLDAEGSAARRMVAEFDRLVSGTRKELAEAQRGVEERLKSAFDPGHEVGHLGRLLKQISEFDARVATLFNPDLKTSYLGQMDERVTRALDGHLSFEKEGSPFQRFKDEVRGELARLQKEIEGYRTQLLGERRLEEEKERGTQKGFTFEDDVEAELGRLARALGDEVERTSLTAEATGSKKGDFVVVFSDTGGRLVIDTKDEKMGSVRAWRNLLDQALQTRSADYALLLARDPEQLQEQVGLLAEYDQNKLVTSLPYLEIALKWARLRTRARRERAASLDLDGLLNDLEKVQAALKSVAEMRKCLTAIGQQSERIESYIGAMEEEVKGALKRAHERLRPSQPPLPGLAS